MSIEQQIVALADQGWQIWHLGQATDGQWACRIYRYQRERRTPRGEAGYDRDDIWRRGVGPTMQAAVSAASSAVYLPIMETAANDIDLEAMLR